MATRLPTLGESNWSQPLNNYIYNQLSLELNTINDLKNLDLNEIPVEYVRVNGYHELGDGGGGLFRFEAIGLTSDEGFIFPTEVAGMSGRWVRQTKENSVNVKWFGAKGDGQTDDYDAFQRAFSYVQNYFRPG